MSGQREKAHRVVLVDDHPLFLLGLSTTLEANGFEVVLAVTNSTDLDMGQVESSDLIVLDVRMGPPGGVDICRALRDRGCRVPIVMLTTFEDPVTRSAAASAGASAFFSKDLSPDELVRRFGRVLGGACGEGLDVERFESLSEREVDVVRLMAEGATNKVIARTLGLSPETVKTHVSAVFRKLDVHDRTAAVVRAGELGWLEHVPDH